MKSTKIIAAAIILGAAAVLFYLSVSSGRQRKPTSNPVPVKPAPAITAHAPNPPPFASQPTLKIKTHAWELSDEEKSKFAQDFEKRFKPAL